MLKSLISKVERQLDEVQSKARTRTYTVKEVENMAREVEFEVQKLPRWAYKYLRYVAHGNVAMSYKNRAEGTFIEFRFNADGIVNRVEISRGNVSHTSCGVSTSELSINIIKTMRDEFGVPSPILSEDAEKQIKLEKHLLKSLGFSNSGRKGI